MFTSPFFIVLKKKHFEHSHGNAVLGGYYLIEDDDEYN